MDVGRPIVRASWGRGHRGQRCFTDSVNTDGMDCAPAPANTRPAQFVGLLDHDGASNRQGMCTCTLALVTQDFSLLINFSRQQAPRPASKEFDIVVLLEAATCAVPSSITAKRISSSLDFIRDERMHFGRSTALAQSFARFSGSGLP